MLSLLAQAATEVVPPADAAGRLAFAAWILYLPAVAALVCLAFGAMRIRNKLPAVVTVLALGGAFAVSLMAYLGWREVGHGPRKIAGGADGPSAARPYPAAPETGGPGW